MEFIQKSKNTIKIKPGFIPNMQLSPKIYINDKLSNILFNEISNNTKESNISQTNTNSKNIKDKEKSQITENHTNPYSTAFEQLAYISTLPGVKGVYALPDIHTGYGFPIGSVSAFDINDGIISPLGVGYDINCGVRSIATNLTINEINREKLAEELFKKIPCGMGNENTKNVINFNLDDLNGILMSGIPYLIDKKIIGYSDHIEDKGSLIGNPKIISQKAKARGLNQLGSLGSGNHYLEIQEVVEILDKEKAERMNINRIGQIIITIHTGSRGLGHQVCTDYLKNGSIINLNTFESDEYYSAMCGASNFAFCNRAIIAKLTEDVFKNNFSNFESALIYDVCHNIAKKERHFFSSQKNNSDIEINEHEDNKNNDVDGENIEVMVHRKGASRAFPPFHKDVPEKYQAIGQPVLVGGSMGTSSYILCGMEEGMTKSLGSACHGAGRVYARSIAAKKFTIDQIKEELKGCNIIVKSNSDKDLIEEAPMCYKDVDEVVMVCEDEKIAGRVVKVKPVIVIKG